MQSRDDEATKNVQNLDNKLGTPSKVSKTNIDA
jgi:hypothetical protein